MNKRLWVILVMLALTVNACSGSPKSGSAANPGSVDDSTSLIDALRAAGATLETGGPVTQDFFGVEGQNLTVNGAGIQVFEYANAEQMDAEAALVATDGGSIGTNMMNWVDAPHFYKIGRLIILYVGSDPSILDLLGKVIGPEFAGR